LSEDNLAHEESIGKALIADDEEDFRRLLVRRATTMGLSVDEASDGTEALEAIRHNNYDILVMDLYMPGATGLDVIREAQRTDPDTEAILMTGSASLETAIEAIRAGVYDYLTKPLESLTTFELTLSRALERRHLIRENERLFKEVQRLAITDQLTGLYNRHKLKENLASEVERARRYGRPLALIMIDLDDLKVVNDTYGHPAGDAVLRQVADAIRNHTRRVDLSARIGGDEFLVLLPEAGLEVATEVAKRVRREITSSPFEDVPISISVGVGSWDEEFGTPQGFLHAVDQALYQAKRSGTTKIFTCKPEGNSDSDNEQSNIVSENKNGNKNQDLEADNGKESSQDTTQ
jgi:diguanylate cyclase (GGDEF)-like protein